MGSALTSEARQQGTRSSFQCGSNPEIPFADFEGLRRSHRASTARLQSPARITHRGDGPRGWGGRA